MYAAPTALTRLATLSDFTSLSEIRLNGIMAACMGMRAYAAVGSEASYLLSKKYMKYNHFQQQLRWHSEKVRSPC